MTFNSATGDSFQNILELEAFSSEVEELVDKQKPVSIEILPIELLTIMRQMLLACEYTKNAGDTLPIERVHEVYQKLEKAFELPPTIKKKMDEKWERLGIQGLDNENPTN